ncbi:MAG: hypothetical protein GY841_03795, partial [FCB group bacterium]|nr:hypothetical protein [FCB group bacterium]
AVANLADPDGALNPADAADGPVDFDSDGTPNAHEFYNDTDPWTADPVPNQSQNPACYYWGDGDGDGIIGPGDVVTVQLEIAGMLQTYSDVIPQVFDTLDLDKDGIPGPNDKTLLDVMFTGGDRAAGYPSSPVALLVTDFPSAPVLVGATTHVTLSVQNQSAFVTTSG